MRQRRDGDIASFHLLLHSSRCQWPPPLPGHRTSSCLTPQGWGHQGLSGRVSLWVVRHSPYNCQGPILHQAGLGISLCWITHQGPWQPTPACLGPSAWQPCPTIKGHLQPQCHCAPSLFQGMDREAQQHTSLYRSHGTPLVTSLQVDYKAWTMIHL